MTDYLLKTKDGVLLTPAGARYFQALEQAAEPAFVLGDDIRVTTRPRRRFTVIRVATVVHCLDKEGAQHTFPLEDCSPVKGRRMR